MKLLLVRLSSLGDLVYVTPLLEALHCRGHEVHLLTDQGYQALFDRDPRVHRLWLIDRARLKASLPPVLADLQKEGFDVALDLHKKPITFWIVHRIGARNVLTINKRSIARRLRVWFRCPMPSWHISSWYAEPLVQRGWIRGPLPLPRLVVPENTGDLPVALPSRYLVVAPEASHPAKEWPYFRALAQQLGKVWAEPVIIVGTRSEPPPYPGLDLRGQTNLRQLIQIIHQANGVIANDSGPAHLAAAMGRPLITLFGPTHPDMGFRPLGSPWLRIVERPYRCRPCSLHGTRWCRFSVPARCLADIPPQAVLQALQAFTIREPHRERRQKPS